MSVADSAPVGVLGGTFDPVHHGHLRLAVEVAEQLGLGEVLLVPAADPPHREPAHAPAAQRLELVRLACEGCPLLTADGLELERPGPSYSIDTLSALRERYGPKRPLLFIVGADAYAGLPRWHRYEALTDHAHLVVVNRPAMPVPVHPELDAFEAPRCTDDVAILQKTPAGAIFHLTMPILAIAATDLRQRCRAGHSIAFLTPPSVVDAIAQLGLYRA